MVDRPARRRSSLADEHPAYAPPAQPLASVPAPVDPAPAKVVEDAPLPPPRRRRTVRVQLNTRVRHDLHERLQAFVEEHDAAVQDIVETALTEYFERRS